MSRGHVASYDHVSHPSLAWLMLAESVSGFGGLRERVMGCLYDLEEDVRRALRGNYPHFDRYGTH